jgi:hypothetical protein
MSSGFEGIEIGSRKVSLMVIKVLEWDVEFKSGCIAFQGLKEVLRRRGVFYEI